MAAAIQETSDRGVVSYRDYLNNKQSVLAAKALHLRKRVDELVTSKAPLNKELRAELDREMMFYHLRKFTRVEEPELCPQSEERKKDLSSKLPLDDILSLLGKIRVLLDEFAQYVAYGQPYGTGAWAYNWLWSQTPNFDREIASNPKYKEVPPSDWESPAEYHRRKMKSESGS